MRKFYELDPGNADENLDYQRGSSCIHTKTGSARSSSTSSWANVSGRQFVSWFSCRFRSVGYDLARDRRDEPAAIAIEGALLATFIEKKAILAPFIEAVHLVLGDEDFVATNPAEPVLTSQLFHNMHDLYPNLRVSHLWDRREDVRKRLSYEKDGGLKQALIIPDIIVHRVNVQDDNLLVVEAKRHPAVDDGDDVWKLEGMTAVGAYHYALGVHITFHVPKRVVTRCVVYSEGQVDAETSAWLREHLP